MILLRQENTTQFAPLQWLLIGGPGHGKTISIKAGASVRYHADNGEDYLHIGSDYVLDGKTYRLGRCFYEGGDEVPAAEIEMLIRSTGLRPI